MIPSPQLYTHARSKNKTEAALFRAHLNEQTTGDNERMHFSQGDVALPGSNAMPHRKEWILCHQLVHLSTHGRSGNTECACFESRLGPLFRTTDPEMSLRLSTRRRPGLQGH